MLRQHSIVIGRRRGMRAELRDVLRRLPAILGVAAHRLLRLGPHHCRCSSSAPATFPLAALPVRAVAAVLGSHSPIPAIYYLIPFSLTTPALVLDGKRPHRVPALRGCSLPGEAGGAPAVVYTWR